VSLLLDTHVFAWLFLGDPRLPPRLRTFIEAYDETIYVSAITVYEMAQKLRLGNWAEVGPLVDSFDKLVQDAYFATLNVTSHHAVRAGLISGPHRDPFDRILVAQATIEGLQIVSADRNLKLLGAEPIWTLSR
jgi:PIN domain nuclease of toxin-antitoxin system